MPIKWTLDRLARSTYRELQQHHLADEPDAAEVQAADWRACGSEEWPSAAELQFVEWNSKNENLTIHPKKSAALPVL